MDILAQAAQKIIQEQEKIIGPIALEQARKVQGLSVNWEKREVNLAGNEKEVLEKLVNQYASLFGQASVEVCKEATRKILVGVSKDSIPSLLQ